MNIVVIDDDNAARYIAEKMLSKIPGIRTVVTFSNSQDAEGYLLTNQVNIIFIDIVIKEENGIEVAKYLRALYPQVIIIFMTSHPEYALEAFDVYALDYMVKPISKERLTTTIEKARSYISDTPVNQATELFVYALGGCNVKNADRKPIKFSSSKSEELLVYLLYHQGKIISKWKIIDDVFPDLSLSNAEGYLKTTVYKLRKALQQNNVKDVLIQSNGGYFIDNSKVYMDYLDLKSKISIINLWEPSLVEEAMKTEQLYQGELFSGKDYRWSYFERDCLNNLYADFAKGLCNCILAENMSERYSAILYILKKLQTLNELDQETAFLFMRLYADLKDRKAFDGYYRKYNKLLKEELGVIPDQEFINYYKDLKMHL
jgi:two-component SAPR family response regulator